MSPILKTDSRTSDVPVEQDAPLFRDAHAREARENFSQILHQLTSAKTSKDFCSAADLFVSLALKGELIVKKDDTQTLVNSVNRRTTQGFLLDEDYKSQLDACQKIIETLQGIGEVLTPDISTQVGNLQRQIESNKITVERRRK